MSALSDAAWVASLFAVDPVGTGGVCLRSQVHPARDEWLRLLADLLPVGTPLRRIPFNIPDGRLLGGLDLTATLRANRPVVERGVLAGCHEGVVVITMSERLSAHTSAQLSAVLDAGEVTVLREAVSGTFPARIGVVALDEGLGADEGVPAGLRDRLAFSLDFEGVSARSHIMPLHDAADIRAARECLPAVTLDPDLMERLCGTALSLGVDSPRVSMLALRAACAAAALEGRTRADEADAILAGRLVLAPRATRVPAPPADDSAGDAPEAERRSPSNDTSQEGPAARAAPDARDALDARDAPEEPAREPSPQERHAEGRQLAERQPLEDTIQSATQAAIPAGLLARLMSGPSAANSRSGGGRAGAEQKAVGRGRPAGVRSGTPRRGARLNVLETLRAAAPWQRLRGRTVTAATGATEPQGVTPARRVTAADGNTMKLSTSVAAETRVVAELDRDPIHSVTAKGSVTAERSVASDTRLRILPSDFRVTVAKQRARTLTIFALDASGSAALNRLAEAKGAVELLLADCYLRRDQVAVVSFRGRAAELLLPPTRSLVRAKRSLAGMPGGGATPLASAIRAGMTVANQAQRRGETPTLVLLSDGRGNMDLNGKPGREAGHADAMATARVFHSSGITALFVDTSPRPNPQALALASAMGARYFPLPVVSSQALSALVRSTAAGARE